MYFLDRKRGIDTSKVYRTESFYMPLQRKRDGSYKYSSGMEMYVGLSTDFFVQEADAWRDEAWRIIKSRPDMVFRLLTKRADRIEECRQEIAYPSDIASQAQRVHGCSIHRKCGCIRLSCNRRNRGSTLWWACEKEYK